ncbi:MAG TPA: LacI family DNA-binding transcriptional regulator [Parapedobacter sp.]|uniref:LacI family DNA-binding transcriptional regulator n=1 Tax=Parapedobacter sp. TaxID=1958893 RepID=UPI002C5C2AD6|nr:LacI family DNA-binding transcriptional regulator [Parapedobacter sp.]HWK56473.1 LacI family DNA-binding transcriptional regulator [Parapedobacter sp.]
MRPSLKHIAKHLGLSKTTVSWVLSGQAKQKNISEATAARVLAYAASLHYQPNMLAQSLNTGETKIIGLILPSISDTFYSEVAREIESRARDEGYSLMISSSESDINREDEIIRLFKAKRVDGIILVPTKQSEVEVQRLIEEGYPLTTIDRYFPELNASYIIINNRDSCYMLAKHLVNSGCKKIALLTTNSYLTIMSQRREGVEDALRESGLQVDPRLYGEVDFAGYEKDVRRVLNNIFAEVPDVDGFFFTTHILALEAFEYFYEKGIKTDFEMACIHDVPIFKVLAPQINVARMPVGEIGKAAVNSLIEQMQHAKAKSRTWYPYEPKRVILPCSLQLHSRF